MEMALRLVILGIFAFYTIDAAPTRILHPNSDPFNTGHPKSQTAGGPTAGPIEETTGGPETAWTGGPTGGPTVGPTGG
eukprot:UN22369